MIGIVFADPSWFGQKQIGQIRIVIIEELNGMGINGIRIGILATIIGISAMWRIVRRQSYSYLIGRPYLENTFQYLL